MTIKGRKYYRRSRRVNGRVVTEHIGCGILGELAAVLDDDERLERRFAGDREQATADPFHDHIRVVLGIDQFLDDLFAVLAARCGFYQHRRQWRKSRRADPMSLDRLARQVDKLRERVEQAERAKAPLLAPDLSGIPEADRATLQAAAKGDRAALAKVEPYLSDPKYVQLWGDPMRAARCWLVGQVAGQDTVVARATHARAALLSRELGFETANALEKVAVTRVVHNWLAVAAMEARACQSAVGSRERTNAEKGLTQAERRLMQAVKTLAFLRGTPVPALMARVGEVIDGNPGK